MGSMIANTTAMKGIFQRISAQFARLYKRKIFFHLYKGEGMDEMHFEEADRNVRDLITEYQDKQDSVVDLDDDEWPRTGQTKMTMMRTKMRTKMKKMKKKKNKIFNFVQY